MSRWIRPDLMGGMQGFGDLADDAHRPGGSSGPSASTVPGRGP